MANYFIGDVHGCYKELMSLLELISYNNQTDKLYFSGDLINKGPHSYETIKFVMNDKGADSILGNHDLHFLALATGNLSKNKKHNLNEILNSSDCNDIVEWLRFRPILINVDNNILVHAGIYPGWSLTQANKYGQELEIAFQSDQWLSIIENMYGNYPDAWNDNLTGNDRLRALINIFTRMRFIGPKLKLDFNETGNIPENKKLIPWYEETHRINKDKNIFFGHWASLQGQSNNKQFISLDGGCVWGGKLIAYRLNDQQIFTVKSLRNF